MWEFLLSLFGGLFWGGKIASESAKTKIANQKLAALRISTDEWYAQVKDYAFEVSIRKRIGEDGFAEQAEEALDVIRSFPHLQSANFAYGADKNSNSHIEEIVTYIQMVKRGKLSSAWVTELCRDLGPSIGVTLKKSARIAFGRWVEATLREHGIVGASLYYSTEVFPSFKWEPFVYDTSNAVRITAPDIENRMFDID